MLDAPDSQEPFLQEAQASQKPVPRWRTALSLSSPLSPTRRALLLTALGGLMIAGVITVLPDSAAGGRLAGLNSGTGALGVRTNSTFDNAKGGDCLNWPERTPDAAQIVDCTTEHRFEVAESIDMRTFPGTEYGPDAAPPSPARIQQISQEQCQSAVQRYLGDRYDPNGRFSVSLLWSGEKTWRQAGERRMLCGLQLPGANNQQQAFQGKVADIDQSKVWPAGTCLGIDPATNQPTDIPVDCAGPHSLEVTGAVNLAEKFPEGLPPEADQDTFVKDNCSRVTDAYLAPLELRITTLTLVYSTIALPSWSAGSHQVSCSIGATLGNGGWSTLLNSAKGPLMINGRPPVPPPDIPDERLNIPAIPLPPIDTSSQITYDESYGSGSGSGSGSSSSSQQTDSNEHLPGQTSQTTEQAPATETPTGGNTFLNGPPLPPPPPAAGPPMEGLPPGAPPPAPGAPPPAPPPGPAPVEPVPPPLP
ncbi:septum formation family protein [Mycobacterium sp. ITM-2016-00316]|uniref:septum formation family protein n=1 Tax=Mycobacterium sp. ITM-2016-00316 TaxID=2099695 RepID=UPI00287FE6BC|nr:septum formation family protein [Mycobacterium sp. ITM-2016-00316]WNG81805.1 septum formation family protein [Mycobacterium sp. ITM-2016-00316]